MDHINNLNILGLELSAEYLDDHVLSISENALFKGERNFGVEWMSVYHFNVLVIRPLKCQIISELLVLPY